MNFSFLTREHVSTPEIARLEFTGNVEQIDDWVRDNATAIQLQLVESAHKLQKEKHYQTTGQFDLKTHLTSEMQLCKYTPHIYRKLTGFKIIPTEIGWLGVTPDLTSGGPRDAFEHSFAFHPRYNTIVDFTFAQGVYMDDTLVAGERVQILQDIIPEFIFRPNAELAVLRGNLNEIQASDTLQYSMNDQRG
ncbi:MAG: hypothetical protein ABI758_05465 [Candidatus Woesebacteria bacterium]